MLFNRLVETSAAIAATRSRKQKAGHLGTLLPELRPEETHIAVAYLGGELPQGRIGLGYAAVYAAVPPPADEPSLHVLDVDRALSDIAAIKGKGSKAVRAAALDRLLASGTKAEQDFLRRLILRELRQGALEGIMVDNTRKKAMEEQLKRDRRKFRNLSIHDNLTGLFNTRYLYQELDRILAESKLTQKPFSLVFMDMDHFKQVVDTYGHLNGSRAIREVARTIDACLEAPAYAVAYAGDEFVVVLPEWDQTHALQKAAEIHATVKRTSYILDKGIEIRLKASLGVATFPQDANNLNALIAAADQALFTVKATGKDGVGRVGR